MKNMMELQKVCREKLMEYKGFESAMAVYETVGKIHKYAQNFIKREIEEMKKEEENGENVEFRCDNADDVLRSTIEWILRSGDREMAEYLREELTALAERL